MLVTANSQDETLSASVTKAVLQPELEDHTFALCLTHDVDRPYKSYQAPYYTLTEGRLYHLKTALAGGNPYWQFDTITSIENDLGVRSAFYFLHEQRLFRDRSPREWIDPRAWKRYAGRYAVDSPNIAEVVRRLDRENWEVGLHGSFDSYRDPELLAHEKATLERVLGHNVIGGRQHYLNLEVPETWQYHASLGLQYDSSPGSSTEFGFNNGYGLLQPFHDEFVVFPLTLMEVALPDPSEYPDKAWEACRDLLFEAADNEAVMTILWHVKVFSEQDFPGYRRLYRRIVERALELGAWVGPPGDLYNRIEWPTREPIGKANTVYSR